MQKQLRGRFQAAAEGMLVQVSLIFNHCNSQAIWLLVKAPFYVSGRNGPSVATFVGE